MEPFGKRLGALLENSREAKLISYVIAPHTLKCKFEGKYQRKLHAPLISSAPVVVAAVDVHSLIGGNGAGGHAIFLCVTNVPPKRVSTQGQQMPRKRAGKRDSIGCPR